MTKHRPNPSTKPATSGASRVGVQDIADALGISRGTVDRALNEREGVSAETKRQVLRIAEKLGYRPNLAARYLSSSKHVTIGLAIPREVASFYDKVREGIFEAASMFEPLGVKILHRPYNRFGQNEIEAIRDILQEDVSGLVISPAYPNRLTPLIEEAASRNIPVVCVATDAPRTKRLTCISVNPLISGALAGELLGYFLPDGAEVIVFIGMHATVDHEQKLQSFRASFRTFCPKGAIVAVVQTYDEATEAYRKSLNVLNRHPAVKGIYIATANSMPVVQAMEKLGRDRKIKIITTDLFPAIVPHIRSQTIAATIHQKAREQGATAFQTIVRFLTEKIQPASQISINPAVVMRSNLDLFISQESWASNGNVRQKS